MILFRQLWWLLTLVFSPHQFVMSRRQAAVAVLQSRYTCCTYVALSAFPMILHICSTYIGQNWGRQASDTISLPTCLPACRTALSLLSKPAAWLALTAISYVKPTRRRLHHSACLQPIWIAVCSYASHATCPLNRAFISDSHTQEIVSAFAGQRVQCILLGLQLAE